MHKEWQEGAFECDYIDWSPAKNHANKIKHGISFDEAAEIFLGRIFTQYQDWHGEHRYGVLGFFRGTVLFVACAETADSLRIVSARKATPSEKRRYGALVLQGP